jgi:hypothetical protein
MSDPDALKDLMHIEEEMQRLHEQPEGVRLSVMKRLFADFLDKRGRLPSHLQHLKSNKTIGTGV